jgi:protein prenyltransferase alpha subunit repeat containing protein 1
MSRSLDRDLLTKLGNDDATAVYEDIAPVLAHPPDQDLLDIELLGQSHPLEPGVNLLRDGNAIAIPKLRLVQAFFVARRILARYLAGPSRPPADDTVEAASVALLMDPEHLTAANIRKRAVEFRLASGAPAEPTLQSEKRFLDGLLTARLHRHTKSPTLWSHRRWLMEKFRACRISTSPRDDLVRVIMIAAERHPRNYYAWDHARWLIRNSTRDASPLAVMADDVKEWCIRNPQDISGWTFLSSIILSINEEGDRRSESSSVLIEVLEMAKSFRWKNESVWVFLRTMMTAGLINQELIKSFSVVNRALCSDAGDGSSARRIWDEALRCSSPQQKAPI